MLLTSKHAIKHQQKKEKPKAEPKKRGRKPKSDREQWLKEQAEKEANMPIYEKKIEDQLDVSLNELRKKAPIDPKWGVKKNSEDKNEFWFGNKAHLAVNRINEQLNVQVA